MRIFKIENESDLKKVEARNIEPIKITKTATGWDVEVEEDVDLNEIVKSEPIVPSSKKESEKKEEKEEKKPEPKKKKKKKKKK